MANTDQYRAQDFIDNIPGTGGIISTIARRVGCSWNTAQRYIEAYPTIQKAYRDECETVADVAELTVIKAIQSGDVGTARWYLSTKGASRGYSVKQDVDLTSGGEPILPFQQIVAALKRADKQLTGHDEE